MNFFPKRKVNTLQSQLPAMLEDFKKYYVFFNKKQTDMIEKYTVIWSFRNRFDVLKNSIASADKFTPKSVDFCLVDASSTDETIKQLREYCNTITDRKVRICESSYRSSLSEAWNLGMMLTENRYVIFASSDVEFLSPNWFYDFYNYRVQSEHEYILMNNHAVFLIDKKAISKMGWFDEEFVIGPHFDCDYLIRASENGVKVSVIANKNYYTHIGENQDDELKRLTTEMPNRLPMNDLTNERYFKSKWNSGWLGWENNMSKPHPPTHISQVQRIKPEIDAHPIYTKKCK